MSRLLLALALVAGATGCDADTHREIVGVWAYDSFSVGEVTTEVEVDVNAASQPYVVFGEVMTGMAGCNGFEEFEDDPYRYEVGRLQPGEVVFQAAACTPESLMESEAIFQEVVWGDNVIDVDMSDDSMTWQAGEVTLTFSRVDQVPQPAIEPETSVGSLDCSPDPVHREKVPAEGTDAEEVANSADPKVARVETEDERRLRAEGYDSNGEVIVVVSFDDMAPETYSIYTCP
jgi:heat shock protein HslJ